MKVVKNMKKFQEKLRDVLDKYRDKTFYVLNNESITYGELLEKSENLSKFLRSDSSPVIVYGHKNIDMVISFIGCILANRCYIPVDIFTPLERIEKIIDLSKSSLVINVSGRKSSFSIDSISNIYDLETKCSCENNNDVCYTIFTSGSTGVPKGVPISYDNLSNFIEWISNIDGFELDRCNVLNQASFSFDLSVTDFYYSLFNGHTLIGSEKFLQEDLNLFLEYIYKNSVNVCVFTPTFMKYLLLDKGFGEENYHAIKVFYFCGEVLDSILVKKIYDRFPSCKVINAYGPTEATSAISSIVITEDMLLLDKLPVGEVDKCNNIIDIIDGEIVIKGKSVFSGYLGNVVGGHFLENGINCYKTGDLGSIEGNYLYCLGRRDNQIKLNGYRIELEEIEKVIKSMTFVDDCCVCAKKDNIGKVKCLKAFVVGDVSSEDVISFAASKLPNYMIPKFVEIVEKLPVNSNGKIDRKKIENL